MCFSFIEDEVLTACALRFDGYKFVETNTHPGLEKYLHTPSTSFELHPNDHFNLARFFFLQRYLYKWGGEYARLEDREHLLFRFLFLHVYRLEIPPEYRMDSHFKTWEERYKPRQEYYAGIIRNTFMRWPMEELYNDEDVPE